MSTLASVRVVVGVPGGTGTPSIPGAPDGPGVAADLATLEAEGVRVLAVAATALELRHAVAGRHPAVVLLHAALPHANRALVADCAAAGAPCILLVDRGRRGTDDLLAGLSPYPAADLAQMERLGCVFLGAWPPVPGELGLLAAQAADRARALLAAGASVAARTGPTGGTIALRGEPGGAGKTALAANLAATLAVLAGRRVALVEADLLGSPRLGPQLGLLDDPRRGLDALHAAAAPLVGAAVRAATEGQPDLPAGQDDPLARAAADTALGGLDLGPFMQTYPPGAPRACDVLPGVTSLDAAQRVAGDTATLHALVRLLTARYDDVVLDLGSAGRSLVHEELAARADLVLVVSWATPDALAAAAAGHARLVRATGLAPARCRLVLNHVGADLSSFVQPLDALAYFAEAGGIAPAGVIPSDPDLVGRARLADPEHPLLPVLLPDRLARRSGFVRGVEDLATHVRPGALPMRPGPIEEVAGRLGTALRGLARGLERPTEVRHGEG